MDSKKVWFITGASKGFGLCLVKQLLYAGECVAATSRDETELLKAVNCNNPNFLPLQVDLADETHVADALQRTYNKFGKIDVVINNAGYGVGGAIEELTDAETRQAFDINVFATFNVIRCVMPYLRKQRSGHIINIASSGGLAPGKGWSVYCAAKYAVVGLTDVLADDVRSLGIKVTLVAPGGFRTSFLRPDSLKIADNPIADYEEVHQTIKTHQTKDGVQIGDPEKAAAAIIKITAEENPPLYLLLGGDAYNRVLNKQDAVYNEIKQWAELTCSTDL